MITAVFFDVDEGREIPKTEPADNYLLDIVLLYTVDPDLHAVKAAALKAVKTTAFDLQLNPATPGMSFHKLDSVKDRNFQSVQESSDLRINDLLNHGVPEKWLCISTLQSPFFHSCGKGIRQKILTRCRMSIHYINA